MDTSPLLGESDHWKFQMLIGVSQWLVTTIGLGRPDLCYSVSLLSRFMVCPHETRLHLALHIFGYLKKFPDKRIGIVSSDIDFSLVANKLDSL